MGTFKTQQDPSMKRNRDGSPATVIVYEDKELDEIWKEVESLKIRLAKKVNAVLREYDIFYRDEYEPARDAYLKLNDDDLENSNDIEERYHEMREKLEELERAIYSLRALQEKLDDTTQEWDED